MPAMLTQGLTAARDALKTLVTHVGISTDNTAFSAAQTRLDPSAAGTNQIEASTEADVDAVTFDASINVTGAEVTGSFFTVGILDGSAATDALSRSVRTNAIGIDADDVYDIAVRVSVADNTP